MNSKSRLFGPFESYDDIVKELVRVSEELECERRAISGLARANRALVLENKEVVGKLVDRAGEILQLKARLDQRRYESSDKSVKISFSGFDHD